MVVSVVGSVLVTLVGVLTVFLASPGPVGTWLALVLTGLLAGAIAARSDLVWSAILGTVAGSGAAWWLAALGTSRSFWWLGVAIALVLVTGGFMVGTSIGWRRDPGATATASWRRTPRPGRIAAIAVASIGIVAVGMYTGYVAVEGSSQFTAARDAHVDCRTPTFAYGWPYEAVNYDRSADATLEPVQVQADRGSEWDCSRPGAPAGDEVVSSDGIRLAAWYVPGVHVGPTGPTVVIVPGFAADKSDILRYAPAFHDSFNVVLMDVRNVGQSQRSDTTLGLYEQRDVRAIVDWLERAKHPAWVALVGNSMGGATSLAEAVTDTRIRALILDSMHASLVVSLGNILETEHGHPSLPGSWAIAAAVSGRVGGDVTSIDPVSMITRVGARPVLLTHGSADAVDVPVESAQRNLGAAMAAGVPVALHYCPGATHGHVIDVCPAEWARWTTSFLEGAMAR